MRSLVTCHSKLHTSLVQSMKLRYLCIGKFGTQVHLLPNLLFFGVVFITNFLLKIIFYLKLVSPALFAVCVIVKVNLHIALFFIASLPSAFGIGSLLLFQVFHQLNLFMITGTSWTRTDPRLTRMSYQLLLSRLSTEFGLLEIESDSRTFVLIGHFA